MPRANRCYIEGHIWHITHRCHRRRFHLRFARDRRSWVRWLYAARARFGLCVFDYCVTSNHVHLLARDRGFDEIPRSLQLIAGCTGQAFNARKGHHGGFWEDRYHATAVESGQHLARCLVYIDLNPVRAGLSETPRDYPWSSHGHYIGARHDRLITPHPIYWELGNTPFAREAAYAQLVQSGIGEEDQRALTDSVLRGWALGDASYVAELQRRTLRRVSKARAGRPALVDSEPASGV